MVIGGQKKSKEGTQECWDETLEENIDIDEVINNQINYCYNPIRKLEKTLLYIKSTQK